MKDADKENLYKLLRHHDNNIGSSGVALLSLSALKDSICCLKIESVDEFYQTLSEVLAVVKKAEPRIVPLQHLVQQLQSKLHPESCSSVAELQKMVVSVIDELIAAYQLSQDKIIDAGSQYVNDYDLIIVHSPSRVVVDALVKARVEMEKKFRVLILQHDLVKTRRLVQALAAGNIRYYIIPEYDLSHYIKSANKLFIGALSVTSDRLVIAGVGTSSVVSLCHVHNVPSYLFINSLKISHKTFKEQHIHEEVEKQKDGELELKMMTHSHDTVSLDLIDHLITERGELLFNKEDWTAPE